LLYGLDLARNTIRESDRIVIVEGYMDVIAAHEHGQLNTVASMGTSLTEEQVKLIKPLTRNVVLALDADAAGAAATLRGIEVGREAMGREAVPVPDARGLVRMQDTLAADIRIAELPAGRDPDDLVRADPELWAELLEKAPTFMDYRFGIAVASRDLENGRERAALVEDLIPLVTAIAEPVVRAEYLQRLARLARLETVALQERLKGRRTNQGGGYETVEAPAEATPLRDRQSDFLLQLLASRPDLLPSVEREARRWIGAGLSQELLAALGGPEDDISELLQNEIIALQERARGLPPFSDEEAERAAHQAVERLRSRRLREQMRPQTEAIADHERAHTGASLAELAAQGGPAAAPVDPEVTNAVRALIENMETGRELHQRRTSEDATEPNEPAESTPKEA
jgi:DNA primase